MLTRNDYLPKPLADAVRGEMKASVASHGPLTRDVFRAMTVLGEEYGEVSRSLLEMNRETTERRRAVKRREAIVELLQLVSVSIHLINNLDEEGRFS